MPPPTARESNHPVALFSFNMEDEFFGEKSFQHYCAEFIQHSQHIGDGWEWRTAKECSDGYMCKTQFQIRTGTTLPHLGTPASVHSCLPAEFVYMVDYTDGFSYVEPSLNLEDEAYLIMENLELPMDDCEVTGSAAVSEVIKYEYHVLYSCSYQVPVLYFRASFLDGRPLALEDIWEGVHECYKTRLVQGPWDTITQQEHPILGQPFFVLHPCKTNEFMTAVLKNSQKINRNVNYITSWLSIVGPVVGLHLPLSYAEASSQAE
ncbi:ubiquitin-like-conjugating enzyme ATG10 isoform X2 [Psammomys obesus]|uniref:ubiquitin-like-conjugating enzyme ATG10 isoform X2 n=1 Tax=Psammomys obesus TaxID=48139 RepID=UPI00245295B1|nr:ubiquitin-like-conjugating enzyme ATG10 isoform X2 [Psammomys obesus]